MQPDTIGAFMLGIPAILIAYVALWRRYRPVFWFAVALILLGVGYLVATGAASDIGHYVTG